MIKNINVALLSLVTIFIQEYFYNRILVTLSVVKIKFNDESLQK